MTVLLAIAMAPVAWSKGKEKANSASPNVVIIFTPRERDIISDWFYANRNGLPPGLAKRESLPPGLQKHLRKNGTLPPGLQKKLTPLPYVLESKLIRLPSDYIRIVVGRDILLLDRRNNSIMDLIPGVIVDPNDSRSYSRNRDDDDDDDQGDNDHQGASRRNSNVYPSRTPAPAPAPAPGRTIATTAAAPANRAASQSFPLKVRMTSPLSTDTVESGDSFAATLEEPLYEGNTVVARKGAKVYGQVVESDKGGRVKGVASLTLKLTRVLLSSGRYLDVSSDPFLFKANATKGEDATKIALTTGVGAGIGALAGGGKGAAIGAASGAAAGTGLVLATRGEPAVIPSESVLEFTVRAN